MMPSTPATPIVRASKAGSSPTRVSYLRGTDPRVDTPCVRREPSESGIEVVIDKTAGVVPTLRTILRPFEGGILRVRLRLVAHASEEHAQSDIDLLVVGDVGLADLTRGQRHPAIRPRNFGKRPQRRITSSRKCYVDRNNS